MPELINKAIITVDALAQEYFSQAGLQNNRRKDILAELRDKWQTKGNDPRLTRVVVAGEGPDGFDVMDADKGLEGEFPHTSAAHYDYDCFSIVALGDRKRDTLIAAVSEKVAEAWELSYRGMGYQTRRIGTEK